MNKCAPGFCVYDGSSAIFIQKYFLLWVVFIKDVFFKEFFSNATTVLICKIGLRIPEQLLPEQLVLVKRLKGNIITVNCTYINKDLMLLLNEE